MGVFADLLAEFREPPLEFVVQALLMSEPLADSAEARLELPDDGELRVDGEPQGAHLRRLRSRDVLVEVFDEADDYVRALPVEFVEMLPGEHALTPSGGEMEVRGRSGR
jgi:hypothetical protein